MYRMNKDWIYKIYMNAAHASSSIIHCKHLYNKALTAHFMFAIASQTAESNGYPGGDIG